MIYILLAGLIMEWVYCYYVFEKDLFSPSAILSEVFIISTAACMLNIEKWGVDLCDTTVAVILGGNAVFIIVSTIIHYFYKRKRKDVSRLEKESLNYIRINSLVLILTIIAYFVFSVIFIRSTISILGSFSQSGDMTQAMALYRDEVNQEGTALPAWLTAMSTFFNIGMYILIYVFVNNLIVNKKNKINYLLLLPIGLYLVSSIFTAARTTILLAFLYTLFVVYSLLNRKYQFVRKLNTKYIFKGIFVVAVFLAFFGGMRSLFGRSDNRDVFDHVTYYMGTSINSLDLFIKRPLEHKQFGEELFRNFRRHLFKYGLVEDDTLLVTPHLEFRLDANGNNAGNIYTAYRYYIYDFGYGSIAFFQILLAVFYGIWYERLSYRRLKKGIDLSYIMFAWFIVVLFRFSILNSFFDWLAGFVFAFYWAMFLFWRVFLSLRISFGGVKNNDSVKVGDRVLLEGEVSNE